MAGQKLILYQITVFVEPAYPIAKRLDPFNIAAASKKITLKAKISHCFSWCQRRNLQCLRFFSKQQEYCKSLH